MRFDEHIDRYVQYILIFEELSIIISLPEAIKIQLCLIYIFNALGLSQKRKKITAKCWKNVRASSWIHPGKKSRK